MTGRHTCLQKHTKPVSRHRWMLLMEPSADAAFQIPENHDGRRGGVGHSPLLEKYIFAVVWKERTPEASESVGPTGVKQLSEGWSSKREDIPQCLAQAIEG